MTEWKQTTVSEMIMDKRNKGFVEAEWLRLGIIVLFESRFGSSPDDEKVRRTKIRLFERDFD